MKKQVIMALFSLLSLFWIQPLAWAGKAADYASKTYKKSGVRFDDTKSSAKIIELLGENTHEAASDASTACYYDPKTNTIYICKDYNDIFERDQTAFIESQKKLQAEKDGYIKDLKTVEQNLKTQEINKQTCEENIELLNQEISIYEKEIEKKATLIKKKEKLQNELINGNVSQEERSKKVNEIIKIVDDLEKIEKYEKKLEEYKAELTKQEQLLKKTNELIDKYKTDIQDLKHNIEQCDEDMKTIKKNQNEDDERYYKMLDNTITHELAHKEINDQVKDVQGSVLDEAYACLVQEANGNPPTGKDRVENLNKLKLLLMAKGYSVTPADALEAIKKWSTTFVDGRVTRQYIGVFGISTKDMEDVYAYLMENGKMKNDNGNNIQGDNGQGGTAGNQQNNGGNQGNRSSGNNSGGKQNGGNPANGNNDGQPNIGSLLPPDDPRPGYTSWRPPSNGTTPPPKVTNGKAGNLIFVDPTGTKRGTFHKIK